jgi:hypothetical protein
LIFFFDISTRLSQIKILLVDLNLRRQPFLVAPVPRFLSFQILRIVAVVPLLHQRLPLVLTGLLLASGTGHLVH